MTKQNTAAFTLVEIMVVVAIVGILTGMAIAGFRTARRTAFLHRVRADLRVISGAIEQLAFDTNQWPGGVPAGETSNPEVWDLNSPAAGLSSSDGRFTNWHGPYMKNVPRDPWGQPYFFDPDYTVNNQTKAAVGSFGPNRAGRNQYDADNIYEIME